ncbi:MAG: hypothetical protein Q8P52_01545 [bacterium]|nr:hypothetical protein [bacterium]
MNTKTLLNRKNALVLPAILGLIIFASAAFAANISDIEFPVAELGSCASKEECREYCHRSENIRACREFAARHGIGEAERQLKKYERIMANGGPGNCAAGVSDPEKSCKNYCSLPSNMRDCIAYAKSQGLMEGRELEEAEKVLKALDSGVPLPAGCTNEESCRETCDHPATIEIAKECFDFAEKAGLLPPEVNREKALKMFRLVEDGKAPFKTLREFEQCDNPPSEEIFEKCLNFAAENGMIPAGELEMIRKTGGRGPGGCRGEEQCDAYCKVREEECFEFAVKHDLIRPEDRARMQEGTKRMRAELDMAPEEVKICINETIGTEQLEEILSGKRPPGREIGERMRSCFEKHFRNRNSGEVGEERVMEERRFDDRQGDFERGEMGGDKHFGFPPEVKKCLESKLGSDGLLKLENPKERPSAEVERIVGECFRQFETRRQNEMHRNEGNFYEGEDMMEFRRGGDFEESYSEEERRKFEEIRQRNMPSEFRSEEMMRMENGEMYFRDDGRSGFEMMDKRYAPARDGQIPPTEPSRDFFEGQNYNYDSRDYVNEPPPEDTRTQESPTSRIWPRADESLSASIFSAIKLEKK